MEHGQIGSLIMVILVDVLVILVDVLVIGYIPKLLFGVGPAFDTEIRDNRPYKIAETFFEVYPNASSPY